MEVTKRLMRLAIGCGLVAAFAWTGQPALAQQDAELQLTVRRTFGYRGGDQIQGRFELGVEGPYELVRVTFLIDGEIMAEDLDPPFEHRFDTQEYSLGSHRLGAVGRLVEGGQVISPERELEFVSAEASWEAAGRIVAPLLVVTFGLIVVGTLSTSLLNRNRRFRLGEYSRSGGAVCPRCRLPFSRGFWSLNVVGRKLERCPHCRRWSLVPRAPSSSLAEAEARMRAGEQPTSAVGSEEIRRLIEDSRYEP